MARCEFRRQASRGGTPFRSLYESARGLILVSPELSPLYDSVATLKPEIQPAPPLQRWFADAALLLTAILWGANILVFKSTIRDFDPWIFNAYRLILATIALGLLALFEAMLWPVKRSEDRPIPWPRALAFCLLSGFLYMIVFVKGMSLTTAGNTALILASMPMWTAILSYFMLAERLPRVTWFGLLVTFVGTVIVTSWGSGEISLASQYFIGNLCILGAAMIWASGTVLSRPVLQTMSPLQLAFLSALLTTPLHIWLVRNELVSAWSTAIEPSNLLAIVYSGVFSTGVAYATWHAGVRAVGGSHAAVYQNVVTLVAVVGGWIFLKEQPLGAQLFGGVLMIGGLLLMRRGR